MPISAVQCRGTSVPGGVVMPGAGKKVKRKEAEAGGSTRKDSGWGHFGDRTGSDWFGSVRNGSDAEMTGKRHETDKK